MVEITLHAGEYVFAKKDIGNWPDPMRTTDK